MEGVFVSAPVWKSPGRGAFLCFIYGSKTALLLMLKNKSRKHLTRASIYCIFALSIHTKKSETMTYSTEFFAVQQALQIENASNITATPFAALDSQYKAAGRLVDITKTHPVSGIEMRGIFVDGVCVLVQADGKTVNIPADKAAAFFGL